MISDAALRHLYLCQTLTLWFTLAARAGLTKSAPVGKDAISRPRTRQPMVLQMQVNTQREATARAAAQQAAT